MLLEIPFASVALKGDNKMLEEFNTTTQVLNNQLASLTWAQKAWEQRVTLSEKVACSTSTIPKSIVATYYLASKNYKQKSIVVRTLSQMQF